MKLRIRVKKITPNITLITLCAVSGMVIVATGCKSKEAPAAAVSSAPGKASAGAATTAKPEPWQEEAKQRAIQQGPAIEAALKAQQEGGK